MTRTEYTNYINTLLASGSNITAAELRTAMQYAADFADAATQKYLQALPGYADTTKTYLRKDAAGNFYWGSADAVTQDPAPDAPGLAIDDELNIATVTPVAGFPNPSDYEYEIILS